MKRNSTGPIADDVRILVVLMGSLGDLVRGLSLAAAIKECLPHSHLSWLVESKWKELVLFQKSIDRVILFERQRGIRGACDLLGELFRSSFDITLDLQRHLKSGLCSLCSGSPRRIGFHRRNSKELNFLFNNEHIDYYSDRLPKLEHYFKFLAYLGISYGQERDFGFSELKPEIYAGHYLNKITTPFAACILGSSSPVKDWSLAGYLALAEKILSNSGLSLLLLGDKSQTTRADALSSGLNSSRVVNICGLTGLLELTALLKAAVVAYGPDSGPGHIAAAVGTPYIALFGPTDPRRVAPYRAEHLVVQAGVDCSPCLNYRKCSRNGECMAAITAEMVWQKLCLAVPNLGCAGNLQ